MLFVTVFVIFVFVRVINPVQGSHAYGAANGNANTAPLKEQNNHQACEYLLVYNANVYTVDSRYSGSLKYGHLAIYCGQAALSQE